MENNEPKVAIIVLNWNGLQDAIACLESLKKSNYKNCEIIIVDNGSKGNDADVLEEKYGGYAKIIRNKKNLGFSIGNNVAIEYALSEKIPADYVFILNNDATLEPNCINACVKAAKMSGAGIVGAVVVNSRNNEVVFAGTASSPLRAILDEFFAFYILKPYHAPSPQPEFWESGRIQGCAMLISSKLLKEIRKDGYYLNSNFFYSCEEADICFRARKAGYKIVIARDARAHHYYGKSMQEANSAVRYYITRNKILLAKTALPWYIKPPFHLWYILNRVLFAVKNIVSGNTKASSAVFRGLFDGYAGVKGEIKNN